MNQPYTYLIGWSSINKFYYGVRFAKRCNPKEFWCSYHTSSRDVKKIRSEYGEPDIIQIRQCFSSHLDATEWEEKVIRRMKMVKSDKWVNKGNAGKEFNTAGKTNRTVFKSGEDHIMFGKPAWNRGIDNHTEAEKQKRSRRYKGEGNPNFGKTHTDEAKRRIGLANIGNKKHAMPHTDETKEAIRQKTMKQVEAGNISTKIKLCCVICQKEVNQTTLTRFHRH